MVQDPALQEMLDKISMVDLIGGYLPLKKAGRIFKGLCPFHPEKTPSFMVYPEKQFFICYGCGVGGDLITFVMKHEKVEFPEAVEILAQKAGVPVPLGRRGAGRSGKENEELYRANEWAAGYFKQSLADPVLGREAREYVKKRGLDEATCETMGIGYAPGRWDGLILSAKKEGIEPAVLEKAGLVIARDGEEGFYDRFRDRVMFPIWDARGRVIAFGGRLMGEAKDSPKYMNSPETALYVKGNILYGIHLAGPQIRTQDFCIVVEGYMDMIGPYQFGVKNAVASMGTSLTESQVKLIRRYTQHVVMVYDGDAAGQAATLRGLDILLDAQMRVRIAVLPGDADPDSLIRRHGIDAFTKLLRESKDLFDYKLGMLTSQFNPSDLQGRMQICQELLPTIRRVPTEVQRGEYLRRLSDILKVSEDSLRKDLSRVKLESKNWKPEAVGQAPVPAKMAMSAEDLLAALLLEDPNRIRQVEGRVSVEDLLDPSARAWLEWLLNQFDQGQIPVDHRPFARELPRDSGEWDSRLAQWLAWADSIQDKERVLDEVIAKIHAGKRKCSMDQMRVAILAAEQSGDEPKAAQLIMEYSQLVKQQTVKKG